MAQIASEDYDNLLIYLHVDTVTNGYDPALMQQEHRTLRRLNANGERKYDPMVTFVGNESKGGGNFTPPSTRLRQGVRIVPYDTGLGNQYSLSILSEILCLDDGLADRAVFNRSSVAANVDIDKAYDPVEVKEVEVGSGVTAQDKIDIVNLTWERVMEGDYTAEEILRILAGVAAGKSSGHPNSPVFRDLGDTKDRVSGTLDSNGNRTSVTIDET